MATNPMQRKARNSFLLGMLLTTLILGAIIAFLIIQMINANKKEQEEIAASVQVYTLAQDVKSGQIITTDMLKTQTVNRNLVPANATSNLDVIQNYSLEDKEGNAVTTRYQNNNATLYITIDDKEHELLQEENGNYYIENGSNKEYIELNSVPLVAKVDMKANTVITTDLLSKTDNVVKDDTRKQEYNMFILPTDLQTGDYIDVRLMMPSGTDYIVVSKKEVEIPMIAGIDSTDTISINLNEDEILLLSNAIVDAYKANGAKLYVTRYTEPGTQAAAQTTYPVNREVMALINANPNIIEEAKQALWNRYNAEQRNDIINPAVTGEEADTNLQTKMEESITNSQTRRQEYLEGLSAAAPAATNTTTTTTNTTN